MKLSDFAKLKGVSYKTAYRWFKSGTLNAEQMPSGTIIVKDNAFVNIFSTEKAFLIKCLEELAESFCIKIYGLHIGKEKLENIKKILND